MRGWEDRFPVRIGRITPSPLTHDRFADGQVEVDCLFTNIRSTHARPPGESPGYPRRAGLALLNTADKAVPDQLASSIGRRVGLILEKGLPIHATAPPRP